MDAWQARQPETRLVRWPWACKEQLVTMPQWYWQYFDSYCLRHKLLPEQLHHQISESYPVEQVPDIGRSIRAALDVRAYRETQRRHRLANDNMPWHPRISKRIGSLTKETIYASRLRRPVRFTFPVIKSSSFKPMARPKRLFAEAEVRDR